MQPILKRLAAALPAAGLVLGLGACDDLLRVSNPGAIDDEDVNDSFFIPQMVNAAVHSFQSNFSFLAYAGSILTDEALNGHNFVGWQDIDLRIVEDHTGQVLDVYQAAQAGRAVGDDMIERLRPLLENPATDLGLATALAYNGYAYVMLGEYYCSTPVAADGPAVSSDEILQMAVQRFDEAIRIAQTGSGAEAQRILNLARVGAARASLQQGKSPEAIGYARPVPVDFVVWARHAASPTSLRNYYWGATTGTNRTIGVDPAFRDLNDARVRHTPNSRTGHNQKTRLFTPARSPAFEGWHSDTPMDANETVLINQLGIQQDTDMRLASGLEARYILAEAGGMTDAELREFIDARRAVGQQAPFTGTDLQAELRDQRRRDFFLGGHRVGDLRRYQKLYNIDDWPSGPHPNDAEWGWGQYGTATCFIPHRNEATSNPNYRP
jgi:starch-binding outer membrane protein, SusD/RagB family